MLPGARIRIEQIRAWLADPTDTIYVCEGERATDAARGLGLQCVTSAGGSKAARQTDWTPLADPDAKPPEPTPENLARPMLAKRRTRKRKGN